MIPIALCAYNRPEHFKRVLDALEWLGCASLYIFIDGPHALADCDDIKAVRFLAESITWTDPFIIRQRANIGLARSIVGAVDTVLESHECVIVLEDDCVPGPQFMCYMGKCLELYADNPKVISVGGYTMKLPEEILAQYPHDAYFFPRIETWGWATWRRTWALYERDTASAYARARQASVNMTAGGNDIPAMIEDKIRRNADSWSGGWLLAAALNNMLCVYPTRSHIQNIGMDGSGVHCGKTTKWDTELEMATPSRFPAEAIEDRAISEAVLGYYR